MRRERIEHVGEEAGGGERGRKECKVGRRGLERRREREEEAEGLERVGVACAENNSGELVVAEEGEQTGEVYGLGVVRDGGEVGGDDEVDDGDVGVEGAGEERGQGARRNARHSLRHGFVPEPEVGRGPWQVQLTPRSHSNPKERIARAIKKNRNPT